MKHAHLYLLFLSTIILLGSCKKDSPLTLNIDGFQYLGEGNDSDCDSDICSTDRALRGIANNVIGSINFRGEIAVTYQSDLGALFIPCIPLNNFEAGQRVRFSGDARNACGFFSNEPFFEEGLIIHITQIDTI